MSSPEVNPGHVLDVERHGGEQAPDNPVPKPAIGSSFKLDLGVTQGITKLTYRFSGKGSWNKAKYQ